MSSPMKAKRIGDSGCVGVSVANAVGKATGIRLRHYPITLDKLVPQMPSSPPAPAGSDSPESRP